MILIESLLSLLPAQPFADLLLLGQRGAIDAWLDENPRALGILFLLLGGALAASGLLQFRSGLAAERRGQEGRGSLAKALSILRMIGGAVCIGFALYKLIAG